MFIIDTGINANHHDFEDRASLGAIVGNSAGSIPDDEQGHGTFVAGVVGGTKYGVAKSATLISVKALNSKGAGTTSDVLEGLAWVLEQHQVSEGKKSIIK